MVFWMKAPQSLRENWLELASFAIQDGHETPLHLAARAFQAQAVVEMLRVPGTHADQMDPLSVSAHATTKQLSLKGCCLPLDRLLLLLSF
jgi:hypothetical protein